MGRQGELELFETALGTPDPPFAVLYVHGPGGVGKTALLQRFAETAGAAGAVVARLDARHVEASPAGLLAGLRLALDLPDAASPLAALSDHGRVVLLVDTYEAAAAADDWVREELLPTLPAGVLVVLAGRNPPAPGWRADPGWRELLRVISLRNLRPEDSRAFLQAAEVPERLHAGALAFSHGHPLALSLLADLVDQQGVLATEDLEPTPDLVCTLLERFTAGVPSVRHRQALEACSQIRAVTEPLLRAALDAEDVGEVFTWLRGLSCVEPSQHGLVLHDLAREVLDADLRWRDPAWCERLLHRLSQHLTARIQASSGPLQQRLILDALYLHRGSPALRGGYDWDEVGTVYAEPVKPGDKQAILAMTRHHEGAAAAEWAGFWFDRQPQAFTALRGGDALQGFACYLRLHEVAAADRDADPATRAAWTFVERHGPARPGEHVTFLRFGMDAQTYQESSPAFNLRAAVTGRNWLCNPRLAWDLLAVRDPYALDNEFAYLDYDRAPEADFSVGDHRYLVFAHDWRARPLSVWMDLILQRGLAREAAPEPPRLPAPLLVLSQPEFEAAVKAALRDLARPELLLANPLLNSRLVHQARAASEHQARAASEHQARAASEDQARAGQAGPAALVQLIRAAAEGLCADARDEKLYRAVDRTYLRPAQTQELAAQGLGLPFSTYRRHLNAGVARITARLWHDELYAGAGEQKPSSDWSGG